MEYFFVAFEAFLVGGFKFTLSNITLKLLCDICPTFLLVTVKAGGRDNVIAELAVGHPMASDMEA